MSERIDDGVSDRERADALAAIEADADKAGVPDRAAYIERMLPRALAAVRANRAARDAKAAAVVEARASEERVKARVRAAKGRG